MRYLFIILFWFSIISLNAEVYYVQDPAYNANASNGNAGTNINYPWATWGKALTDASVNPGDTVYFRGGVYMKEYTNGRPVGGTITGTVTDSVFLFNYPGEVPILDCSNTTELTYWGGHNQGISIEIHYVRVRGLKVRNVFQLATDDIVASMFEILDGNHSIIENCSVYNGHGTGIKIIWGDEIYLKNCDAYNHYDPLTELYPGNDGNGIWIYDQDYTDRHVYLENCRTWLCGDQGFALYSDGYIEMKNCWGFRNGLLEGEGWGVKLGMEDPLLVGVKRRITNCVFVYNRDGGINTNDGNGHALSTQIYNNTIYRNGYYSGYDNFESGIIIFDTYSNNTQELTRIYRNNIVYDNERYAIWLSEGALYTHDYNNWDIPLTLTSADFVSIDSTGITAPRQADGSLPDNNCYNYFLKLSETSQAIDEGIDVGLPYIGDAPDLGFSEFFYEEELPASIPLLSTLPPSNVNVRQGNSGGNAISDGGAAITVKGICWSISLNPTTADSKTNSGTGEGNFTATITGLSSSTTYHVRAYATNSEGTGYGADNVFTTPKYSIEFSGGKVACGGEKILIIK